MTERRPRGHDDRRGPLAHLVGLAAYLVVLWILSLIANANPASTWSGIVAFLIATVWVVVVLTVANLLADLVLGLPFPVNLPGVLLRAVAGAGTAWYVVQILLEVDRLYGLGVFVPLAPLAPLLYVAVFVLVLSGETLRLFTPRTPLD
ncbi:hypothetical protein DSECCO2_270640 [anaerobic digester metagenome]